MIKNGLCLGLLFLAGSSGAVVFKPLMGFAHRDSIQEWHNPAQYGGELLFEIAEDINFGMGGYFNPEGQSAMVGLDSITGNAGDANTDPSIQEHTAFVALDYVMAPYFTTGIQGGLTLHREVTSAGSSPGDHGVYSKFAKNPVIGARAIFHIPLSSYFCLGSQSVVSWYLGRNSAIGFANFAFVSLSF
jgi:hypothetical protein